MHKLRNVPRCLGADRHLGPMSSHPLAILEIHPQLHHAQLSQQHIPLGRAHPANKIFSHRVTLSHPTREVKVLGLHLLSLYHLQDQTSFSYSHHEVGWNTTTLTEARDWRLLLECCSWQMMPGAYGIRAFDGNIWLWEEGPHLAFSSH